MKRISIIITACLLLAASSAAADVPLKPVWQDHTIDTKFTFDSWWQSSKAAQLLGYAKATSDSEPIDGVYVWEQAFIDAADKIKPSVVSITTTKRVRDGAWRHFMPREPFPFDDFLGRDWFRYFERQQPQREFKQSGLGSGVIVDQRGYILTNNHVIDGADELKVHLSDGRQFQAELVGTDSKSDVAVIKIDAPNLKPAELGRSSGLRVGQWVMAVGSPFGLNQTFTAGMVSALGRDGLGVAQYEDFIQTDAAINQGNSGGPLINLRGQVVGINTAIMSRGGGNDGIGMAIPIDMAKHIMDDLIDHGKVDRGWLGVSIQDLTPDLAQSFGYDKTDGVLIAEVLQDTPAYAAGLKSGDIVLKVDGKETKNASALRHLIAQTEPDTKVKLDIWREGRMQTIGVKLGRLSDDVVAGRTGTGDSKLDDLGLRLNDPTEQVRRHYDLADELRGAVITHVEPGTPAGEAGLRPGDVIVDVQGVKVVDAEEARRELAKHAGKDFRLRIRNGNTHRFVVIEADKE